MTTKFFRYPIAAPENAPDNQLLTRAVFVRHDGKEYACAWLLDVENVPNDADILASLNSDTPLVELTETEYSALVTSADYAP